MWMCYYLSRRMRYSLDLRKSDSCVGRRFPRSAQIYRFDSFCFLVSEAWDSVGLKLLANSSTSISGKLGSYFAELCGSRHIDHKPRQHISGTFSFDLVAVRELMLLCTTSFISSWININTENIWDREVCCHMHLKKCALFHICVLGVPWGFAWFASCCIACEWLNHCVAHPWA